MKYALARSEAIIKLLTDANELLNAMWLHIFEEGES